MSEENSPNIINTVDVLLTSYAAGQRDFNRSKLGKANLAGVTLKGSDLSYADLSEADLSGANLRGCDLSFADLSQANLQAADLRGALLMSTDLRQADFRGAKLEKADCDRTTHFPLNFDPVAAGLQIKEA